MFALSGPYTHSAVSLSSLSEALRKYQEVLLQFEIKLVKTDLNPLRRWFWYLRLFAPLYQHCPVSSLQAFLPDTTHTALVSGPYSLQGPTGRHSILCTPLLVLLF